MKAKITSLILFLCFYCGSSFSQEVSVVSDKIDDSNRYIYVGSLPTYNTDNAISEKLKIEVLGGNWSNSTLSTTTYTIGVRSGVTINLERSGAGYKRADLKVYKTSSGYDFVLERSEAYSSFNIKVTCLDVSKKYNVIQASKAVSIAYYNVLGKEDVTSKCKINIITATDRFGNLGIGTEAPLAKLDVRGKIIANEVEVKVNAGADFVFEPSYNLRPLSELESFVKENKHLPEIPSEKEMQENGLNVNDMQIKLLQKVEELTLYVIEQNKRIGDLEKELSER